MDGWGDFLDAKSVAQRENCTNTTNYFVFLLKKKNHHLSTLDSTVRN